ncbi:uncharacterized protein B0H18DRAFT_619909 [Fomitopsis serialis]|uniref:uncharacterized protein n=1 Tax=Fomitopsis serialis TaxID=139415 RepID=UPI00200890AE|nr:uncharacterized protein B0H18DRAFT_619909 [Neoantrodia serialis]KAH9919915.1 hypothetical protein B0H18DRAFT_619909 [Neoantrodia serialis]
MEHHARKVEDCYRAPTYSMLLRPRRSDTSPQFPQELIDYICELLRLDPFTLTRWSLVCHAWYHAARRVSLRLRGTQQLTLTTREILDDYAHMLWSHGNRPYGKTFDSLLITEDPRRPFIRVFPIRIPGYVLPQVTTLWIQGFDCAVTRPHDRFFRSLSCYTSITRLNIVGCRFRSMAELRRISNALPMLEDLSLRYITLQHPLRLVPNLVSRYGPSRNKLKFELRLHRWTDYSASTELGAHIHELHPFLLDVCATYPYATSLWLDLRCWSSFSHLHQLISRFSRLSMLSLSAFGLGIGYAAANSALYTVHGLNPSKLDLDLTGVLEPWASQALLAFTVTPQAYSQLETLTLRIKRDSPCTDLGRHVTEVLRLAGTALKRFDFA